MKTCKKCKLERNDNEFTIIKSGPKLGYVYATCLFCKRLSNNVWRNNNKQLARRLVSEWIKKNRYKCKAYEQDYYSRNKEKVHERHRSYRKRNPQKFRKWLQNRKLQKYVENQNRRALKNSVVGSFLLLEWEELKRLYNHSCLRCGLSEPDIILTMDHIIPITKEFTSNYIYNIQPLCKSCNSFKGNKVIDYRKDKNIMMVFGGI